MIAMSTDYHCPRMAARMSLASCEANRAFLRGGSPDGRRIKGIRRRRQKMGLKLRADLGADRAIYCRGCPGVEAIAAGADVMTDWRLGEQGPLEPDNKRYCTSGTHLRVLHWDNGQGCRACRKETRMALEARRTLCRRKLHAWPASRGYDGKCTGCARDRKQRVEQRRELRRRALLADLAREQPE